MTDSRPSPSDPHAGMVLIPAGTFTMGSDAFYPEEAPRRGVSVDAFRIDRTPVTNRQFARFVEATGHVTVAEIPPDLADYPGALPGMDQPGSLVFRKPPGPVPMDRPDQWWKFEFGADWRHPLGPDSSLDDLDLWDHPVVHVAWSDAEAFARWAGKALPTEAEFEYAARGGLEDSEYAWGDVLAPDGAMMANYWQGLFPFANQCLDGWERTSPVRSFPPNGYGLYDMIGNTWSGPPTGGSTTLPTPIRARRRVRAAPSAIPGGAGCATATIRASRSFASGARCSRAVHTSVPKTTASAIAPPHAIRKRSTPRRLTSAFGVSSARGAQGFRPVCARRSRSPR